MKIIFFVLLILVCAVLVAVGIYKKKMELVVNFFLRATLGLLACYVVNIALKGMSVDISVGFNSFSILTMGSLGIPGFLLLYGISTYFYFR